MQLIYNCPLCAAGQGHFETRSDGGDCNADTTEAVGTRRLKSMNPNTDLRNPRSHQHLCQGLTTHVPEDWTGLKKKKNSSLCSSNFLYV